MPTIAETSTAYHTDPRVTANDDGSYTVNTGGITYDVSYADYDSLGWVILTKDDSLVGYFTADDAIHNLIGAPQS